MKKISKILLISLVWITIIVIATFLSLMHTPDMLLYMLCLLLAYAGGDLTSYIWIIKKYSYEKTK